MGQDGLLNTYEALGEQDRAARGARQLAVVNVYVALQLAVTYVRSTGSQPLQFLQEAKDVRVHVA